MIQTPAHFSTNTLYVDTHLDDEDVNFTNFTIKKKLNGLSVTSVLRANPG